MNIKKRPSRSFVVVMTSILFLVLIGLVGPQIMQWHTRHQWKEEAISKIAHLSSDKTWISNEVSFIKGADAGPGQLMLAKGWLSNNMVLMRNGEWLVYQSHCAKAPPHHMSDLCIAKGSDGKWYYTTCHFCIGMIALIGLQESSAGVDGQDARPINLASFIKRHQFNELDGKFDECLKKTKSFPDNP